MGLYHKAKVKGAKGEKRAALPVGDIPAGTDPIEKDYILKRATAFADNVSEETKIRLWIKIQGTLYPVLSDGDESPPTSEPPSERPNEDDEPKAKKGIKVIDEAGECNFE
jgi:hypothetical protein